MKGGKEISTEGAFQARRNLQYKDAVAGRGVGINSNRTMGRFHTYIEGKPLSEYRGYINGMLMALAAETRQDDINKNIANGIVLYSNMIPLKFTIGDTLETSKPASQPTDYFVIAWIDEQNKMFLNPEIRIRAYRTSVKPTNSMSELDSAPFFECVVEKDGHRLNLFASGHASYVHKFPERKQRYFAPLNSRYSKS